MHPISAAVAHARRSFCLLGLCAVGLLVMVGACGNTEKSTTASGGSGGAAAGRAGATAVGGNRPSHEDGGAAGSEEAGAAGELVAGAAGAASASGDAGAPGDAFTCLPGGALFVAGNYLDASGNDLLLRSTATAATLALVPQGVAIPGKLPLLFAVERACAPGGAVIARDESTYFRVDFQQVGSKLALCFAPAPTFKAALQLEPADLARATDTGCLGKPFQFFTQGAL